MSNAKHTPGPWHFEQALDGGGMPIAYQYLVLESTKPAPGCDGAFIVVAETTTEARAALIAAVPELLAALEQARARLWIMYQEDDNASPPILDLVDAAIAKATLDNS